MKFNCLIIKWRYSFLCFNHVWNMNRQYVSILTLEKQSVSIFYEFIKLLQRKERMKSKGRMDYGIRSLKDQRLYQNSVVLVHCINVKAPQRGKWFNLAFESVWSSLVLAISARLPFSFFSHKIDVPMARSASLAKQFFVRRLQLEAMQCSLLSCPCSFTSFLTKVLSVGECSLVFFFFC